MGCSFLLIIKKKGSLAFPTLIPYSVFHTNISYFSRQYPNLALIPQFPRYK